MGRGVGGAIPCVERGPGGIRCDPPVDAGLLAAAALAVFPLVKEPE